MSPQTCAGYLIVESSTTDGERKEIDQFRQSPAYYGPLLLIKSSAAPLQRRKREWVTFDFRVCFPCTSEQSVRAQRTYNPVIQDSFRKLSVIH